MEVLDFNMWY